MKKFFGFKKNKCKQEITLPDIHSFSLSINNEVWGNYQIENADGVKTGIYVPANSSDYWEVILKGGLLESALLDIPIEDLGKYTVLVSFSNDDTSGETLPNVLIATGEIKSTGWDDIVVIVSVYNPTSFDMVFSDTHKLHLTLIENV